MATLSKTLTDIDSELIKIGQLDDQMIIINFEGETEHNLRSTMISQAIYHAVEHRAQLVDALEFRGYRSINLDDIDLWQFENYEAQIEKNS